MGKGNFHGIGDGSNIQGGTATGRGPAAGGQPQRVKANERVGPYASFAADPLRLALPWRHTTAALNPQPICL
jgi:hypothetical protein